MALTAFPYNSDWLYPSASPPRERKPWLSPLPAPTSAPQEREDEWGWLRGRGPRARSVRSLLSPRRAARWLRCTRWLRTFREFPLPASTGPVTCRSPLRPPPRSPHYRRTRPPCTEATRATYLRPSPPLLSRCPSTTSTRRTDAGHQGGRRPRTAPEGTLDYLWRKNVRDSHTRATWKWRMLSSIILKDFIFMKFSLVFLWVFFF